MRIKKFLPFSFFILYVIVFLLLRNLLADPKELFARVQELYGQFGYQIVWSAAFLESTFLGLYIPGSTVVLLGAAFAKTGVLSFPLVLMVAMAGFLLGYTVDYCIGRYGWYHVLSEFGLEKGITIARENLQKHRKKAMFFGYVSPSTGSLLATAAGMSKVPYWQFIKASFVSQLIWSLIWGTLAYVFGLPLVELFLKYFGFFVVGLGVLWFGRKFLFKPEKGSKGL